jgi:hypothetical protein
VQTPFEHTWLAPHCVQSIASSTGRVLLLPFMRVRDEPHAVSAATRTRA